MYDSVVQCSVVQCCIEQQVQCSGMQCSLVYCSVVPFSVLTEWTIKGHQSHQITRARCSPLGLAPSLWRKSPIWDFQVEQTKNFQDKIFFYVLKFIEYIYIIYFEFIYLSLTNTNKSQLLSYYNMHLCIISHGCNFHLFFVDVKCLPTKGMSELRIMGDFELWVNIELWATLKHG